MKSIDKINGSQAGQGTVEYVLLLSVVILVIFGFLSQFNSAFGEWSKNYFGDYVACLLEYGELPGLGGGTLVEGCDAAFSEFSLANGRNPFGPGIGASGSGKGGNKDGSGEGGGSGRISSDSSGRSGSSFLSRNSSSQNNGGAGGAGRVGKFEAPSSDESSEDLFGGSRSGRMTEQGARETILRPRQIFASYDSVAVEKKVEEKKAKVKKEGETVTRRPPRLTVRERSIRQTASAEETSLDMGFGGFVRFLFIMAIIIAIIILLGGQALQISKEWD